MKFLGEIKANKMLALLSLVTAVILSGAVMLLNSLNPDFLPGTGSLDIIVVSGLFLLIFLVVHVGLWKNKRWGFYLYILFWGGFENGMSASTHLHPSVEAYFQIFPVLYILTASMIFVPWHPRIRLSFFPEKSWPQVLISSAVLLIYFYTGIYGVMAIFILGSTIFSSIKGVPLQLIEVLGGLGLFIILVAILWLWARGLSRFRRWAYVVTALFQVIALGGSVFDPELPYDKVILSEWRFYLPQVTGTLVVGLVFALFMTRSVRGLFFGKAEPKNVPPQAAQTAPVQASPARPRDKKAPVFILVSVLVVSVLFFTVIALKKQSPGICPRPVARLGKKESVEKKVAPAIPQILAVNKLNKVITLSLNDTWGIKPGDVFKIYREESLSGEVTVTDVSQSNVSATPNPPATIDHFRASDEVVWENPLFFYRRGELFLAGQQYAKAEKDFQRSLALNPKFALGHLGRGKVLYGQSQYIPAIDVLNQAIAADQGLAEAYYQRALAYYGIQEMAQPLVDLSKAIELKPDFVEAYQLRLEINVRGNRMEDSAADIARLQELGAEIDPYVLRQFKLDSDRMRLLSAIAANPKAKGGVMAVVPAPPAGFKWTELKEIKGALLVPNGWHVKYEGSKDQHHWAISKENIDTQGSFETGLTLRVTQNVSTQPQGRVLPSDFARAMMAEMKTKHAIEREEACNPGVFTTCRYQFVDSAKGLKPIRIYNYLMANDKTGTLFHYYFEAPVEGWDAAWETAEVILKNIVVDDEI